MRFIVDENVSFGVVKELRASGHAVIAIAEGHTGMKDNEIYEMVIREKALLITRDFHFTNSLRFPPQKTEGIIYLRHGNLKTSEEIEIIVKFIKLGSLDKTKGSLVTLERKRAKIRPSNFTKSL